MTRSELVANIARSHPDLSTKEIERSVKMILDAMINHLANGERVEIRGFGSFDISHRPARVGRNLRTGQSVEVPGKPCVHFKTGKELRQRANKQHNQKPQ